MTSALHDAPEPGRLPRPRNVNIALGLLVGALLIQLLPWLWFVLQANYNYFPPRLAFIAAEYSLIAVLILLVARGMNWARYVLLALVLARFAQTCWEAGYAWREFPDFWDFFLGALNIRMRLLPLAMNLAALHLLFFSSGQWFAARKTENA